MRRKLIFDKNLERNARVVAKEAATTVRFWFRKKYGIPETDPRYLDMTEEAMLTDYWSHYYFDKPGDEWEAESDDFEDELAAMDKELGIPPDDDFEDISHGEPGN